MARPSEDGYHNAMTALPQSIDETQALLAAADYFCARPLATATFLALVMHKPLLLEGEPGVGKTEIAKALAKSLGRRLIRLQCYEGLDLAAAAYEWNYARQMIEIRLNEGGSKDRDLLAENIFSERFLIERPLLQALREDPSGPPVLLIDELDRTDEPFEAYLLEILSDFQMTIPEMGTIKAAHPPIVIVTSNRTREIHDALKRRCLYHWVNYPDPDQERAILERKQPGLDARLAAQIVAFVNKLRNFDLFKKPGVAETLDWAEALRTLNIQRLEPAAVRDSLGVLLKYQDDLAVMRREGRIEAALADAPA